MKVKTLFLFNLLILLTLSGCSGEDEPSPEQTYTSDNVYLEFNRWVYAQMNKHYLWREDLPDSLSCDFDQAPKDFFNSLLSDKDRFSVMTANENYNPGLNSFYGIAYQDYMDVNGNVASQILYVTSSEAEAMDLKRGDWIKILGKTEGELSFKRVSLSEEGNFNIVPGSPRFALSSTFEQNSVLLDTIYSGKTGYLCYLKFEDDKDLEPVMRKFYENGIEELILDLRYNPGGYVATCKYLSNCIVPENGYGEIFQITEYNDLLSQDNIKETGSPEKINYFGYPDKIADNSKKTLVFPLNLKRLFVLTSSHSASASEALILCLKPYMEVIQIGETTVGKGVGSYGLVNTKYKYGIQPITMRYYNAWHETVEETGLVPNVYMADGYNVSQKNIGDRDEPLLQKALGMIEPRNLADMAVPFEKLVPFKLIPLGAPSYVDEFNNILYNESN